MSDNPKGPTEPNIKRRGPAAAYFCPKTGKRLVGPGVSKDVDAQKGVDEYVEPKPAQKVK